MKPVNFWIASRLTTALAPPGQTQGMSATDVAEYGRMMEFQTKVATLCRLMTDPEADMPVLRIMMTAELMREPEPRLKLLQQLLHWHEQLNIDQRTRHIYDELPAFAVFADRTAASGQKSTEIPGNTLHNMIQGALHATPKD
jgi:hypothetical protein